MKRAIPGAFLLLALTPAIFGENNRPCGPREETPLWWDILLNLETEGNYRLEGGDRTFTGNYSFSVRWRGFMERDDDDYLLYTLDNDLLEWSAEETASRGDAATRSTTGDFKDRPFLVFNYIIRKNQQLHLDFIVHGIVVPQAESEDSALLLFPSSAENNQRDQQVSYNNYLIKGSNRIVLDEEEIYAGAVGRTYSWTWKHQSWTLRMNRTVFTAHSHGVIVRLSIIPRYARPD